MIKIRRIEVEDLENAGCNNGNYPEYTVYFDNGEKYNGVTCRCGAGCSGMDRICKLRNGMDFESMDDFVDFVEA